MFRFVLVSILRSLEQGMHENLCFLARFCGYSNHIIRRCGYECSTTGHLSDSSVDRDCRAFIGSPLRAGSVRPQQADHIIKPWVMNPRVLRLNPDPKAVLEESLPCSERDLEHLVTKEHH